VRRGLKGNSTSIRRGLSSSTRLPRTPRWRAFTVVRPEGAMPRRRAPWPLENHHLHCRAALRRDCCAHGSRRPDERRVLAYVEQALVPELRPRDIVIMDNLPAHKVHGVRQAIEPPARACDTCRLTVPTSIPSKWPSPSSRPCCAPPQRAARIACGGARAGTFGSHIVAGTSSNSRAFRITY
jgi:hypothetical protein